MTKKKVDGLGRKGPLRKLADIRVRENLGLNQQLFDLGMRYVTPTCGALRESERAS